MSLIATKGAPRYALHTVIRFVCSVLVFSIVFSAGVPYAHSQEPASEALNKDKTPDQRFDKAVEFFEEGEYKKAQEILNEILFPKPLLDGAEKIAKAHVLLSAAYLALGNMKAADRVVKVIIEGDVNFRFDSDFDPSLIAMAERHRANRQKEIKTEEAMMPAPAPPPPSGMTAGDIALHVLPFGVGQFSDGRYIAGAAYLLIQLGLGAANLYLYSETVGDQVEVEGESRASCKLDLLADCNDNKSLINGLGAAFYISMALSVAESFVFRPDESIENSMKPSMSFNLMPSSDGGAASLSFSF